MAPAQASPRTGEGSRRHKPILSTLTEKLSAIASPLTIEVSSPLAIDDLQSYWHPSPIKQRTTLPPMHAGSPGGCAGVHAARGARGCRMRPACAAVGRGFLGRGSACIGRRRGVWPARACLHSCGGRRGSAQAAERIARAGTERLACGRKAQASTGFGLHAHDCARVSVLVCRMQAVAGHRQAQSGLFSLV